MILNLWGRWMRRRPPEAPSLKDWAKPISLGEIAVTRVVETEECISIVFSGLMGNGDPRPLRSYLAMVGIKSTKSIVLDLTDVSHIWPVGIGMLMELRRRLEGKNKRLSLANVGQHVLATLDFEGVRGLFSYVQTGH
jgi:anti-anti-sigma factor